MITQRDPTGCLRPGCRFYPQPHMNDRDELEMFAYCSMSCKEFTEAAVAVAEAPFSAAVERQAEWLFDVSRLLDARTNPGDFEAPGGDV